MDVIEEREQPAQKVKVKVRTDCDWCGKEVNGSRGYNVDELRIEWRGGESYPEGGSGPWWKVDLCHGCMDKLFALMEQNGVKIQKTEWDW